MAVTTIKAIHKSKNKSVKGYLKERIDYAVDKDKTENGKYVSTYMCDVELAHLEFNSLKNEYFQNTGRKQTSDVLAYQVMQSFDIMDEMMNKLTPKLANEIGVKLAEELTKGEHSFIVATHLNTDVLHNHILWNSTNLDAQSKWVDVKRSGKDVAKASDLLCMKYGLSVIRTKKERKEYSSYGAWKNENDNENNKPSLRYKLQFAIDEVLEHKPKSLEEFLGAMKN